MKHGYQTSMRTGAVADLQKAWTLIMVANMVFLGAQTAPCNSSLVTGPLGVEDHALTGLLPYGGDPRTHPQHARILDPIVAYYAYLGSYLQVRLRKPSMITGFVTQGRSGNNQFITEYSVQYSDNGITWQDIKDSAGNVKLLTGNTDDWSLAKSILETSIVATYIRVTPTNWKYDRAFRLEILGCPILQSGLHQTCWSVNYVAWISIHGIFSTIRTNMGECGKECHVREACQAFIFNHESGQCQGYSPSSVENATEVATTDEHNMIRVFMKRTDCV
ncbi:lactadherin-like [Mizuhopecten yessoensis]|uniref:lactadherin-like n=1 Tax=Mizuhopecten yessoensis TaxID=6573 RepID=UPI000B45B7CD|nr:lactadherin-like [Mizuhopecten yessoensis]